MARMTRIRQLPPARDARDSDVLPISLIAPALALGASYSIPVRIVRINT